MTLVADSSPPNLKNPKLDDFRSFPMNCCVAPTSSLDCSDIAPGKSASYIKRSRFDLARDFSEINGTKGECCGALKKPRLSEYGLAIPAVPLKYLPPDNAKWDKDPVVGQKMSENTVGQQEDSWEHDSEKLAAILAEAKEFIDLIDAKYSKPKDFQAVQEENRCGMETNGEDSEEEVCVLSPSEWNMLTLNHKDGGAKSSTGKIKEKTEKWKSHKSSAKSSNSVGTKSDQDSEMVLDCKLNQRGEMVPDCEMTETEYGEEQEEHSFMDPEPEYCENHEELINLQFGQNEQPQRIKVLETLKLFEEQYVRLPKEREVDHSEGRIPKWTYPHVEAAERVKKMGKSISVGKPFGHIAGIEIGDEFRFRAELAIIGLHRPFVHGIDYVDVKGKKCATSVVDSGRYENKAKGPGVLIYIGHGGNPKINENAADQKLERGNLALVNSMEMGFPVRVIYKRKNLVACRALGTSNERDFVYVYDGLYTVNDYWHEREEEQGGKLVYKFELHRMSGQPKPRETNTRSGKSIKRKGVCVLNDVSRGKEKFPIRAVNNVDDDLPPPFTYITEIVYPDWFKRIEPIGCDCTNDCFDSEECPCLLKNGLEIPFNKKGAIVRAKPRVYECGPTCKCHPGCINRVTQHGPRHQLEIFKTELRGWGVRCRGSISSGSFICEYVGEFLRDKDAEQRINNDEYLFDICESDDDVGQGKLKVEGFALDAAVYGNIGRFINHSCSPNLFAQEVFYNRDDKRMPHIMFFAAKDIPHHQELTYDYNYKMGRVCDANGNTRTKDCYCGSRKCTGKMY